MRLPLCSRRVILHKQPHIRATHMSDTPPTHAPDKHPLVQGTCEVQGTDKRSNFTVNLDTMECNCQHGDPWHMGKYKWEPANLCNHKLTAVASLCAKHNNASLRDYYETQLGRRYNAFEAVSAMHKEIRRGDVSNALHWATIMIPHRGRHGIVAYLRNILFEETRDLSLARYILQVSSKGRTVTSQEMQRAVTRFCLAPKKWELAWRLPIFIDEQRGYRKLAKEYGYDVAKPKDIIPFKEITKLRRALLEGFKTGDRVTVQYGLKGWFKSKSPDHDEMKVDILNVLIDVMNGEHPNKFKHNDDYVMKLYNIIMLRMRNHGGVGYHELNALADALTGENAYGALGGLPMVKHRAIVNKPVHYRIKLADHRRIPIYAHDNHTWGGKARMRNHREQLRAGANQTDLDFRLCGAYMGVAWRSLAFKQHATIDCKWGDVNWTPTWLWTHLDNMWY